MAFDWKTLVSTLAPTIASTFGGPVAGLGVKALLSVFGLAPDADDKTITAALQGATPEQLLALKKADEDFAVQMKQLDIDIEKINAGDRDSARRREVDSHDSVTNRVLAFIVIGGFFGVVGYVLVYGLKGLDAAAAGFAGTVVGYVSAKAEQVISYYFGSSSSSRGKDATITALAK